jgi:DNA helicase HerA-like ATPase
MPPAKRPLALDLLDLSTLKVLPLEQRTNRISLVVGMKGKGKSTWVRGELERRADAAALVVWDPKIEYPARLGGRSYLADRSPVQWIRRRGFPARSLAIRFQAAPIDEADVLLAIAATRPPSVVVLEEIQLLCPGGRAPRWLMHAISVARHHALSIIATSQRPALVSKDIIANADHVVAFGLGNADDREQLYRSRGDPRFLELTDGLAPGQHLDTDESNPDERPHRRRNHDRPHVGTRRDGPDRQGPPVTSRGAPSPVRRRSSKRSR